MTLADLQALIGMVTGIAGMVVGTAALALNWLTRRDLKRDRMPVIVLSQGRQREPADGWAEVDIRLRSRSSLGYRTVDVRVLWPLGARIAPFVQHWRGYEGKITKWIDPVPARRVDPGLEVTHAGIPPRRSEITGQMMGSGEEHHSAFLFTAKPSIWSMASLRRRSASSDWSHTVWALFMVRLIDQNAVVTDHRRTVRLKITKTDDPQSKS